MMTIDTIEMKSAKLRQYIAARDDAVAWAQIATAFVVESLAQVSAQWVCHKAARRALELREELNDDS